MKELEKNMKAIEMDGLTWGASKLVPLAFGIKKLQINLVVEDEKVSIDDLQQQIEADEDHVQSTDVVSSRPRRFPRSTVLTLNRLPCKSCRYLAICWQASAIGTFGRLDELSNFHANRMLMKLSRS